MDILGIGGFSHDSAACLVRDGRIVAAAMEERFTRRKHEGGIPRKAVAFCLRAGETSLENLDHVAMYMSPMQRLRKRIPYRLCQMAKSFKYSAAYIAYELVHNWEFSSGARSLCGPKTQLHYCDHHGAHAASSFFVSPFEEAALLTLDYIGEWTATMLGRGRGNRIEKIESISYPHSLGVVYSGLTHYLGFKRASDEYKVMGLAGYGEAEKYLPLFREVIPSIGDGRYAVNLDYFQCHYLPGSQLGYVSNKFLEVFGPPRRKDEPVEERHKDIAAALQRRLEEVVMDLAHRLYRLSGKPKNLCIAGGVGLNSVMNGRLLADGPFADIYIQPAAGDDGIAIGAAYWVYHQELSQPRLTGDSAYVMHSAALGPSYSAEAIRRQLELAKIPYQELADPAAHAAELIAAGKIVGWFQGPMEFGPRALGNRSILADPTRPEMKDWLNKYVKHREDFRPFAPSVTVEDMGRFFEPLRWEWVMAATALAPKVVDIASREAPEVPATPSAGSSPEPAGPSPNYPSPFMLMVFGVRPEAREQLPAITHVDGTARVQTVDEKVDPLYYRLIREFEKRRGIPVVLNTSFNVMGEPVVCTPDDALRCFFSTGLDDLVIGPFWVQKTAPLPSRERVG